MQRKQFLLSAITAAPMLAFANLSAGSMRTNKPFVVRSGGSRNNNPMLFMGAHPNNILISRKDTDDAMSVFHYTGHAKVGPPLHVHHDQDEFFHIVEGRYRVVAGAETMELGVGDTIFLPRNVPHTWIQLTDKGRLLYAVQPAGKLEDMFVLLDQRKTSPTEAELQQIHLDHGMKIMGPPLQL